MSVCSSAHIDDRTMCCLPPSRPALEWQSNPLKNSIKSLFEVIESEFIQTEILNAKRAPEMLSLFYFEMLFRSHSTKNIVFMQFNLQNQFLMIIFVFILKLDACCCLNFLHRLKSSLYRNRFMNKYPTVILEPEIWAEIVYLW